MQATRKALDLDSIPSLPSLFPPLWANNSKTKDGSFDTLTSSFQSTCSASPKISFTMTHQNSTRVPEGASTPQQHTFKPQDVSSSLPSQQQIREATQSLPVKRRGNAGKTTSFESPTRQKTGKAIDRNLCSTPSRIQVAINAQQRRPHFASTPFVH